MCDGKERGDEESCLLRRLAMSVSIDEAWSPFSTSTSADTMPTCNLERARKSRDTSGGDVQRKKVARVVSYDTDEGLDDVYSEPTSIGRNEHARPVARDDAHDVAENEATSITLHLRAVLKQIQHGQAQSSRQFIVGVSALCVACAIICVYLDRVAQSITSLQRHLLALPHHAATRDAEPIAALSRRWSLSTPDTGVLMPRGNRLG